VKAGKAVPFARVLEVALILRDALDGLGMPSYPKTTGSRGIHVYVPIVRGPTQKQVWTFAKAFAQTMAKQSPALITAEYKIAKRPQGRVLVDYNQNAWGRTLSSVYSVRPRQGAPVSMPVTWKEIEKGITIEQFTMKTARQRIKKLGDLWAPLLPAAKGRFDLSKLL
jgi:bifunctional non-homologous end joining protein LigD